MTNETTKTEMNNKQIGIESGWKKKQIDIDPFFSFPLLSSHSAVCAPKKVIWSFVISQELISVFVIKISRFRASGFEKCQAAGEQRLSGNPN